MMYARRCPSIYRETLGVSSWCAWRCPLVYRVKLGVSSHDVCMEVPISIQGQAWCVLSWCARRCPSVYRDKLGMSSHDICTEVPISIQGNTWCVLSWYMHGGAHQYTGTSLVCSLMMYTWRWLSACIDNILYHLAPSRNYGLGLHPTRSSATPAVWPVGLIKMLWLRFASYKVLSNSCCITCWLDKDAMP